MIVLECINNLFIFFDLPDIFKLINNEYIILIRLMIDLYEVLLPLFAVLSLINIIVLKLAIRDTVTLLELQQKQPSTLIQIDQNIQPAPFKKTAKFLLLNFTLLEIFIVRRAKSKISLLLSISIISLAAFIISQPFAFAFIGTLIYLAYFVISLAFTMPPSQQLQFKYKNPNANRQKYISLSMSLIAIAVNLCLIYLTYKNYKNTFLSTYITNVALNLALDNFLVRPIACIIMTLPLSRSNKVLQFVTISQTNNKLLEAVQKLGVLDVFQNPGKIYSARKIAKRIPIQIQPTPIDEKSLQKKDQRGYQNPLDVLKRFKKQRTLPPINRSFCRSTSSSGECSLNNLFNFNQKEPLSPVVPRSKELQNWSEKTNEVSDQLILRHNIKKETNENLILVHPSLQEKAQQQQQMCDQVMKATLQKESVDDIGTLSKQGNLQPCSSQDPLKISLHTSQAPSSRHEPLRIRFNQSQSGNQNHITEQNQCQVGQTPQHQTINDNVYHKNSFGVLQIKEQNIEHNDFQQHGVPQKRKPKINQQEIQLKAETKKKNKKRMSCDRVIKFTTGEPYLQYLPNMLNKDHKTKKSQGISRKEIIIESRVSNSAKRAYRKKGATIATNQNRVPEFKIEEI